MSQRTVTTCDICDEEYKPHEPCDEVWQMLAGGITVSDVCDRCRKWFLRELDDRKIKHAAAGK